MGLRDRIKDTLRRAVAPPRPAPPPPPPPRPVPRYRDAEHLAGLAEEPVPEAAPPEPVAPPAEAVAPAPIAEPEAPVKTTFTVRFLNEAEGIDCAVEVNPGEWVLDAGERAGLALPYSCRNGGCTSCTGKLVSGELRMGEQYTLEPEVVAQGFRLLCCAEATGDVVVLTHQAEALP